MSQTLVNVNRNEVMKWRTALHRTRSRAQSIEDIAQSTASYFYEHLITAETGEKGCALVRVYQTLPYKTLPPALRNLAVQRPDSTEPSPDMRCLVLLGTAGQEAAWNVRTQSKGHQVIPLPTAEFVAQAPMISQLIRQFGLDIANVVSPNPDLIANLHNKQYNTFYVAQAEGSPYIPAQKEFVNPYGIRSVVGFGGVLLTGDLFAVIVFSKVFIPQETADSFKLLAAEIKSLMVPYIRNRPFN
jgi:hypothetical protein